MIDLIRPREKFRGAAVFALPFLVYLVHAFLLGAWIVDDAGITFAYARNLASGNGLVSQPGLPPVEGYSNPLWLLGLVPFFLLRLFHSVITPKLLSLALAAVSFVLLGRVLLNLSGGRRAVPLAALLLLAVCTPFVIWTVSGLENPLYVALTCLLLAVLVRERVQGPAPGLALAAGAVAAGIALTRPDGLVYAGLYPLLTLFAEGRPVRMRPAATRIGLYGVAFLLLFGGYLAFRGLYFGDLVPNTYHAKGGPTAEMVSDLVTLRPPMVRDLVDLMRSAAGLGGGAILVALLMSAAFLAGRRRLRWGHGALLAFTACAAAAYLLLPRDWMEEYRFATPFYPFLFATAALLAASLGEELLPASARRQAGRAGILVAVGLSLAVFIPRSLLFAASPTVPFAEVLHDYGLRFNRFADLLGLEEGSFLLPDIGGTLWASRLRVYDLAGLTDASIARALGKDQKALHDYIFEQARPTFIHIHHYWTAAGALDLDPRFRRDYLPLYAFFEPEVLEYTGGKRLPSGDFIRREAIAGKEEAVQAIRAELIEAYARSRKLRRIGPQGPAPPPGG